MRQHTRNKTLHNNLQNTGASRMCKPVGPGGEAGVRAPPACVVILARPQRPHPLSPFPSRTGHHHRAGRPSPMKAHSAAHPLRRPLDRDNQPKQTSEQPKHAATLPTFRHGAHLESGAGTERERGWWSATANGVNPQCSQAPERQRERGGGAGTLCPSCPQGLQLHWRTWVNDAAKHAPLRNHVTLT